MTFRLAWRVVVVATEHRHNEHRHNEHVVGNGTAWTNTDGNTDTICP
jgi:hypothetical protein